MANRVTTGVGGERDGDGNDRGAGGRRREKAAIGSNRIVHAAKGMLLPSWPGSVLLWHSCVVVLAFVLCICARTTCAQFPGGGIAMPSAPATPATPSMPSMPVAPPVMQPIQARDWNMLLGTRWTEWPPFMDLTKAGLEYLQGDLNTQFAQSSADIESRLGNGSTTFLVRYLESMADIAYYLMQNVTGGQAFITPAAGCCGGEYGHFFVYTSLYTMNIMRTNLSSAFVAVQALPWFVKIEPALLGKTLDDAAPSPSGDAPSNILTEPFKLKVVLAPGSSASVQESGNYGMQIALTLPIKPLTYQVLSPEVILFGSMTKTIVQAVVKSIAERPEVLYIMPVLSYEKHNQWAKAVIQSPVPFNLTPLYDQNITGQNQIVGLSDTGIDMQHCFFSDPEHALPTAAPDNVHRKVVLYNTVVDANDTVGGESGGGHGTFVAGVIAGAPQPLREGNSNEREVTLQFSGVARSAKLVFYDVGDVNDALSGLEEKTLKELLLDSIKNKARTHVVPFGVQNRSVSTQLYDLDARDVDDVSYRNENFLVVVSVGNAGGDGLYTLASPAVSKNALAVGASLNAEQGLQFCGEYCGPVFCQCADNSTIGQVDPLYLAHFSGKGPTLDGRIKPDVVAPGMHIWSALSSNSPNDGHCKLTSSQGTSTAAAVIGGLAALVQQYFTEGRYPTGEKDGTLAFDPSGALVKACIIHGARGLVGFMDAQLGNSFKRFPSQVSYPNHFEGWGLVRADRSLLLPQVPQSVNENAPPAMFIKSGRKDGAVLLPGDVHEYHFVLYKASPFRVTLVWMDPPAVIGALSPMVHDLDLLLIDSKGNVTYPNGLSSPDRLNNVERIVISQPDLSSGNFTVRISAVTVYPTMLNNNAGQPYALVATGSFFKPLPTPSVGKGPRQPRPTSDCFLGSKTTNVNASCPHLAGDNFNITTLPVYYLTAPPSKVLYINETIAAMEIGGTALFGDVQLQSDNAATTTTILKQDEIIKMIGNRSNYLLGTDPNSSGRSNFYSFCASLLVIGLLIASFIQSC
ncbi:hypothetical protein CBR_g39260 [Chara braunii]|uniref:Peptidase S8/S53 domain-containing protein n=1 Tax=Chara braunii TaxID=69332 RepID=A0A388K102_CHABU|nr:hypothetical protein CBR_g39260 [Chara braunii]|eukprot:GBG63718.1 hypothetical protein CBR_g39260 [Chara braunii]